MPRIALASVLLLASCWADFPESRLNQDRATPKPEQGDLSRADLGLDGPRSEGPAADRTLADVARDLARDQVAVDQPKTLDVKISCTPGAFVACANSNKDLHKCNAAGDGVLVIVCGAANKCDSTLQRCTECNPASAPVCQGTELATCSTDGLYTLTPCSAGCKAGKCCVDADKDTVSDCSAPPDCNDNNADVFPGQTKYFDLPITGGTSFDYNCNSTEEKESPDLVKCQFTGSSCSGEGWQGSVPACGQSGTWVTCVKNGGVCDETPQPAKKQRCR
jgi:hypothetical protein